MDVLLNSYTKWIETEIEDNGEHVCIRKDKTENKGKGKEREMYSRRTE